MAGLEIRYKADHEVEHCYGRPHHHTLPKLRPSGGGWCACSTTTGLWRYVRETRALNLIREVLIIVAENVTDPCSIDSTSSIEGLLSL